MGDAVTKSLKTDSTLDCVATAINRLPISTGYRVLVFVEIGEALKKQDPSFNLDAWLSMRSVKTEEKVK